MVHRRVRPGAERNGTCCRSAGAAPASCTARTPGSSTSTRRARSSGAIQRRACVLSLRVSPVLRPEWGRGLRQTVAGPSRDLTQGRSQAGRANSRERSRRVLAHSRRKPGTQSLDRSVTNAASKQSTRRRITHRQVRPGTKRTGTAVIPREATLALLQAKDAGLLDWDWQCGKAVSGMSIVGPGYCPSRP